MFAMDELFGSGNSHTQVSGSAYMQSSACLRMSTASPPHIGDNHRVGCALIIDVAVAMRLTSGATAKWVTIGGLHGLLV